MYSYEEDLRMRRDSYLETVNDFEDYDVMAYQPPSILDMEAASQLIEDFGVDTYIPIFDTLEELNEWKRNVIEQAVM